MDFVGRKRGWVTYPQETQIPLGRAPSRPSEINVNWCVPHLLARFGQEPVAVGHRQDGFVVALGAVDVVETVVELLEVMIERQVARQLADVFLDGFNQLQDRGALANAIGSPCGHQLAPLLQ